MASLLNRKPHQYAAMASQLPPAEEEAWAFKDVLGVLCTLNPDDQRERVKSRIQQWHRGDVIPAARGHGKGRPYGYTTNDLIYLTLVSELQNMGLGFQGGITALESGSWLTMWKMGTVTLRPFPASRSYIVIDVERIHDAIAKQREVIMARNMPPRQRDVIDVRKLKFKRVENGLIPLDDAARKACAELAGAPTDLD